MDNQHGKIELETSWLAGITDGDGCIGLHRQPQGNSINFVPSWTVSTTCKLTFDYLEGLLDRLNVGHNKTFRKSMHDHQRDRWVVEIRGMIRVGQLLTIIQPFLITKNQESKLVLDFIKSRKSKSKMIPYTEKELTIVSELKKIKVSRNGEFGSKPSETLCQVSEKSDEDKVRSN